jgi:transposase, IS5 family
MRTASQRLLTITTAMVKQAEQVGAVLSAQATHTGHKRAVTLRQFVPLVHQVIIQTTRRIIQGEVVPAPEKVVSLFEPHTAMIRKGNPGKPTEFGRVIWVDEVEGGIISRDAVLAGNPAEDAQLPPSLDHHRRVFQRPPRLLAGERGVHTTANERDATMQGVAQVVWPKPGVKSAKRMAHEQPRWFRRGHNGRSGIEGRISGLKRRHKLDRCRYHGTAGMERWVGWGVLTHKLRVIAQATPHSPRGEATQPCHGLLRCQMWAVHAVSQRVLHHNLVLGTARELGGRFSNWRSICRPRSPFRRRIGRWEQH